MISRRSRAAEARPFPSIYVTAAPCHSAFTHTRVRTPYATHDLRRRLGGDPLHAAHGQPRRLAGSCGARCAARTPARPARSGMGGQTRRHGQRGRPLARGLQEVAAGDGRRHAERHLARVLRPLFHRPTANPLAARTGMVRPARRAALRRPRRHALPRHRLGRGARPARVAAEGERPGRSFFYASGRSSNEAGFLLQLFARLFGTNYVNNCSYYCHQASGVGLASSLGTGTATVSSRTSSTATCSS